MLHPEFGGSKQEVQRSDGPVLSIIPASTWDIFTYGRKTFMKTKGEWIFKR